MALNTSITVNWLTAITSILKAHLMLTAFANRKALVGAYAVLFRDEPTALQYVESLLVSFVCKRRRTRLRSKIPSHVRRVANFLSEYDVPLKKLQTDFAPVTLKLTVALTNLKDHCFRLLNTDQMRNEGSLSITQNPAEMSIPPPQYVCANRQSPIALADTDDGNGVAHRPTIKPSTSATSSRGSAWASC